MGEIVIDQGYKRFHLEWVLIHKDKWHERYKITPVANPEKYIIIENNRPFLRDLKGLKKRRIDWKQVEGQAVSPRTFQIIIDQIEQPIQRKRKNFLPIFSKSIPNPKRIHKEGPNLGERHR